MEHVGVNYPYCVKYLIASVTDGVMSITAGYAEPARRSEYASTKAPSPYESFVANVTHARSGGTTRIVIIYLVLENFGVLITLIY